MKIRRRFFLSIALVLAGLFSPLVAEASCPSIVVECSSGKLYSCSGTQQGNSCVYDHGCLNGSKCKGAGLEEPENY